MINAPPANWDAELVDWFRANVERFPRTRFNLAPFARVSDAPGYFASIARDVADGPDGPRAVRGVLQEDLVRLRELFGKSDSCRTRKTQENEWSAVF
ncbi:MAG TPA: hypothetical protein VFG04_08885 [Planctomycetaceae bacterium]|jgi:hypothetical protein|nr:hypothetical protein [Planctomycetaceae bacterium]